jgi:hypothetical protein
MKPTSRLAYLSKMLIRYANSWYSNRGGNGPSCRMFSWVDEYNSLRDMTAGSDWLAYCEANNLHPEHTAQDLFA